MSGCGCPMPNRSPETAASLAFAAHPRAHRDPAFLAAKLARIDERHIAPLNTLAQRIRQDTGGEVPWFDPDTGGIHARAVLLLEAPGARATGASGPRGAAHGSGIISPDNNDQTAENSWRLYQQAGLPRDRIAVWNIVPWYLGTVTKVRSANRDDVAAAQPYLNRFIGLLPDLRVVLTLGAAARDGWLRYLLTDDATLVPTLACPHPSPQVLNVNLQARVVILQALRKITRLI